MTVSNDDRPAWIEVLRVLAAERPRDRQVPFTALIEAVAGPPAADRRDVLLTVLDSEGWTEPETLAQADPRELVQAVADHGATLGLTEARSLQRLARWLVDRHDGSVESLNEVATDTLRGELFGLNGFGPAAVDRVLVAMGRVAYPVDRASFRIAVRHGWLDPTTDRDEARNRFLSLAHREPETLAVMASALPRIGRRWCKPGRPDCDPCPLRPFLPEGGPRGGDLGDG